MHVLVPTGVVALSGAAGCCDGAGGAGRLVYVSIVIRDVELKRALSADLEAIWSPDEGDSHLTLLALRSAMQVGR